MTDDREAEYWRDQDNLTLWRNTTKTTVYDEDEVIT